MHKKHKRMQDGGVASTSTAPKRGAEYFANKYSKLAAANPGYKPTLASPVDSKWELREYRQGLQDYLRANRPARGPRGSGGTAPTTPAPTTPAPTKPPKSISEKKLTPAEMRRAFGPMFAIGGPMYPMRGGGLARKGMGVALAKGGAVKKEKGYTEKERKGMRRLFEEHADPYAGDVTGGSSVTPVKKPKKRMAAGGIVGAPARSYRDMRAGAGSGVGRIQKTKIAGRGR